MITYLAIGTVSFIAVGVTMNHDAYDEKATQESYEEQALEVLVSEGKESQGDHLETSKPEDQVTEEVSQQEQETENLESQIQETVDSESQNFETYEQGLQSQEPEKENSTEIEIFENQHNIPKDAYYNAIPVTFDEYIDYYIENASFKTPNFKTKDKLFKTLSDDDLHHGNLYFDVNFFNNVTAKFSVHDTGTYYKGEVKDNLPHGAGMIYRYNSNSKYLGTEYEIIPIYIGYFNEGKYDGYGRLYEHLDTDYDVYWGDFKDDRMFQEFRESMFYRLSFEGEFSKGKKDGDGILYVYPVEDTKSAYNYNGSNSSLLQVNFNYEINFLDRIQIYYFTRGMSMYNNRVVDIPSLNDEEYTRDLYVAVGEFKKNEPNDMKVYFYEQLVYEGALVEMDQYNDFVPHGKGTIYYPNSKNKVYDGEFKYGKYDGKGILYDINKKVVYNGKWEDGDYK